MPSSPLHGLDLREWIGNFDVAYVSDPKLDEHVAVHALTTYGQRNELGPWEIWISPHFKRYERMLVHHEAIENLLRRDGWNYDDSHQYALRKDRERFGHTKLYEELIQRLKEMR